METLDYITNELSRVPTWIWYLSAAIVIIPAVLWWLTRHAASNEYLDNDPNV